MKQPTALYGPQLDLANELVEQGTRYYVWPYNYGRQKFDVIDLCDRRRALNVVTYKKICECDDQEHAERIAKFYNENYQ